MAGGENERARERGRGPQSVRQPLYPMLAASTSADGTVASQTHVGGGRPGEPLLRQESALMEDQVVDLARRELHRPGTPTLLLGTPFFFFLIRERQFYSYNKYTVPYSLVLVSTKKGHP